uniref:Secreted protein n=1 Tax=Macrostomum lignano TaxID=282301 RepID=A0A1I8GH95_9PLAT
TLLSELLCRLPGACVSLGIVPRLLPDVSLYPAAPQPTMEAETEKEASSGSDEISVRNLFNSH